MPSWGREGERVSSGRGEGKAGLQGGGGGLMWRACGNEAKQLDRLLFAGRQVLPSQHSSDLHKQRSCSPQSQRVTGWWEQDKPSLLLWVDFPGP